MAFPLTYSRSKYFLASESLGDFSAEFLAILRKRFSQSHVRCWKEGENNLHFKGQIFRFVWNGWDLLNGISEGKVIVSRYEQNFLVRHELVFKEAFYIALAFTIIPLTVFLHPGYYYVANWFGELNNIELGIFLIIIIWGIFFGGNYLISFIRVNAYIKKVMVEIYDEELKRIQNKIEQEKQEYQEEIEEMEEKISPDK